MKNIFQKIIAACLICALIGIPIAGFATEEGTQPQPEIPVPAADEPVEQPPEPEPVPEPDPIPEPPTEPVAEPDLIPEPDPVPDPEPVENPEKKDETVVNPDDENIPSDSGNDIDPDNSGFDASPGTENPPADPENSAESNVNLPAPLPEAGAGRGNQGNEVSELSIVSFDTTSIPVGKNVPYGTPENELGFPNVLKAVMSDGSGREVKVTWQCIDDDNGGSSYVPEHENPAAVYTFKAALAEDVPCSAELPIIYIAYEALAVTLALEPDLLAWEDVVIKIEEKEYENSYRSIALNGVKAYEFGISCTEDDLQEPDPALKAEIDDTQESHNIILFDKLISDTDYTVWAREIGTELWTAFSQPIRTKAVEVTLTRDGIGLNAGDAVYVNETLIAGTNLEDPVFKWYRNDQADPVAQGESYTLTFADVGAAIKCVASAGDYSGETAGVQTSAAAPVELKLDTIQESLTVVFAEDIPMGAKVVLAASAEEILAALEVSETAHEFRFENMRPHAGKTVQVYLMLNGAKGAVKEYTMAPLASEPAAPEQDKIVFAASSQRSIDFSCTDLRGIEFAYGLTGTDDGLSAIADNPAVITDLSVQADYTLYMRSAATETEFASDWVKAGFNATTDALEVAVVQEDSIYFDSTIAAAPARNYLFAEDYPSYQWYFSEGAEFNENAILLEDVHGAELNLQERGFTKADIGKYIHITISDGYGNISAAKTVQLHRHEDPMLSLTVAERIKAGETITAVYNGEAADLTWEWRRGEEIIANAVTASYTTSIDDAYNVLTVNAIYNGSVAATAYVAVDMCEIGVDVDYVQETIEVSANAPVPEGWTLRAVDENGVNVDKAWVKGSYTLKELGIDPDKHEASAPDYMVSLCVMNGKGQGETVSLTLPTREDYSDMTIDMDAVTRNSASELAFVVPPEFNIGLSQEGVNGPDSSLGSGSSFNNLKEGTTYTVWLRDAAIQDVRFASRWMDMHVAKTGTRKEVGVSLRNTSIKWSPDWKFPGIEIKGDIKEKDIECRWNGTNGGKAGKYTLELKLKSDAAKWFKLKNDKLSFTVEPIAMSAKNTRVTCEQLTYNGKEQLPQKMKVIVDGMEIPAAEFAVEKVSGYDCTKAGSHIIKVVGNGNVTGGIKILYVISKAKPAAISWPTANFLTTGQKLSESRLSGGSTNAGSFAWENGSIVPSAGISKHNVVFTPADTANYDWTGVTMVKPVEVKVYFISSGTDDSTENDYNFDYDFSASSGYWSGDSDYGYEEGEEVNSSGDLAETYLSAGSGNSDADALEIVYDVIGQPMDFELLTILRDYEGEEAYTDHTFMILAQPDADGQIVSRFLRFSLAQLDYLYRDMDFSNLLFRNGDAEVCLRLEDVLEGNASKLAAHLLDSEETEINLLDLDFESMEETVLASNDLSGIWLDVRIDPVVVTEEDETGVIEKDAWDVSLWLCTDYTEVEISALIPSFTIGLNVNGLFNEVGADQFLAENGIVLVDENGGKMLLQSEWIQMPGELPVDQPDEAEYYSVLMPEIEDSEVWTDYTPDMSLNAYRNEVLATRYAGSGMYMLTEIAEGF